MNHKLAICIPALICLAGCKTVDPVASKSDRLRGWIDRGEYAKVQKELPAFHAAHPAYGDEVIDYGLRQVQMPPDADPVDLPRMRALLDAIAVPGSKAETTVRYAQGLVEFKVGNAQEAHALFRGVVERPDASDLQLGISYLNLALLEASDQGVPEPTHMAAFMRYEKAVGAVLDAKYIQRIKEVIGEPFDAEMASEEMPPVEEPAGENLFPEDI